MQKSEGHAKWFIAVIALAVLSGLRRICHVRTDVIGESEFDWFGRLGFVDLSTFLSAAQGRERRSKRSVCLRHVLSGANAVRRGGKRGVCLYVFASSDCLIVIGPCAGLACK